MIFHDSTIFHDSHPHDSCWLTWLISSHSTIDQGRIGQRSYLEMESDQGRPGNWPFHCVNCWVYWEHAGAFCMVLSDAFWFDLSREWGNDPIHNYINNHPSNPIFPHSQHLSARSSGGMENYRTRLKISSLGESSIHVRWNYSLGLAICKPR